MSFSFHSNKVALAVATLATGLGLQFAAVAQTAGTLDITGQVTATTCSLNMTAGGNTINGGSRTVSLGTVASTAAAANTLIGTKTIVKFDLKDGTNPANACALGATQTWNILLGLTATQITGSGSAASAVVNGAVTGGTSAAVALFGGSDPTAPTRLTLSPSTSMTTGTEVFSTGLGVSAATPLYLGAQFVTTSASAPTAGQYSASIPLTILYN
jgi:type 1 fimbria pilin